MTLSQISGFHLEALPLHCLLLRGAIYLNALVLSRGGHIESEVLALVDLRFAKRSFIRYCRCEEVICMVLPHALQGSSPARTLLYVYLLRGGRVFHAP